MFEFTSRSGIDTITDFQNGKDRLDLDDFSRAQVENIIANARQVGDDLVLNISAQASIKIEDMKKAQLDIGDFDF
jgi:hypothetical protein